MKKIVIAVAVALMALTSYAVPSFADTIYFGIDNGNSRPIYRYRDRSYYRYRDDAPRYRYADESDYGDYYRPRHRRCWQQEYDVKSHHHYVTKTRTVCR